MSRKKSPLRVRCKPLLFGMKSCEWTAVGALKAAEFTGRRRAESAIVHPSTKKSGYWQVSFFDRDGPRSDTQHRSLDDALKMVTPKLWKLKSAV